eukprot:gene6616-6844_t
MFGLAISTNSNGSIIAAGAPLNTAATSQPGAAMILTSLSSQTCVYSTNNVPRPQGTWRYFGAQTALSSDGSTLVIADGVEGITAGAAQGNRPVVHVYKRASGGSYSYFQKLNVAPRKSMMTAMALSVTADGGSILVSYSVGEGYADKVGSAQLFVTRASATLRGAPMSNYTYLQDLAKLNMPAGSSPQFGSSSQISSNGMTVVVATAQKINTLYKVANVYRRDTATGLFRIVTSINGGEYYTDSWSVLSGVGVGDDNALAVSQSGRFVLRVENAMLVLYEWSGSGFAMIWKRRCQVAAPGGFTFRTTGGALSVIESSTTRTKFAAGAYVGSLEVPEQMAVFVYYLDNQKPGSCPYRPAEQHVHHDPYSNYGAGVKLTEDGNLLLVGAPTSWDNNMEFQVGALYVMDLSFVVDDGLTPVTITAADNTNAGCINGKDINGNTCSAKMVGTVLCKDVKKADGSVVHYGPQGCTPTPPPPSFWTSSSTGAYASETLSAYTSIAPSIKGGVGVPIASNPWLSNAATAVSNAAYLGYVPPTSNSPKTSIVSTSGWPVSSTAALGGVLPSSLGTSTTGGLSGISVLSMLGSGMVDVLGRLAGSSSSAAGVLSSNSLNTGLSGTVSLGDLPPGAVVTNMGLLNGISG